MGLFGRYIFRQAGGALSLILMSLGGIVWIALALKQLNVVTTQGQDALTLLKMTTLALPNLLAIIAPFALLIATLHTLNRLAGDSELIIMTAAGAPVWVVARPFLLLALLVSLGVAFVNHAGQPWSLQQLKSYIVQARSDLLQQVIQPGRFSSPEPSLTFHIRDRSNTGELYGLLIHDNRTVGEGRSYLAESGIIAKQDDSVYLIMTNGHILRRVGLEEPPQIIVFDKYIVDLDSFDKKNVGPAYLKPRERYWSELVAPADPPADLQRIKGQLRSELHERLSNPLYPFAFVLIALAAAGQAQSTRQNRNERLVVAFLIAVGLRIGGFAVNNLVTLKAGFVPVLYGVPLLSMTVAAILMIRGARPQRTTSLTEQIQDRLAPLLARLPRPARWRLPAAGSQG